MLYYWCEVELLLLLLAAAVFYRTICHGLATKVESIQSESFICAVGFCYDHERILHGSGLVAFHELFEDPNA
jgi:hypothetical protein